MCGWCALIGHQTGVLIFSCVPILWKSACQKSDVNLGSLSLMMASGRPCSLGFRA